ncbi:MAG: class I SAM-dependent methyltransferase [Akkermansiaceae bacterium]|jgi:predicted O-methyltransferase YrrM
MKILCANLRRRPDRRFVTENTLPEVNGLPVEFFDAVDGAAIPGWKLNRFPEGTTGSSYAVRLTKRLALREFLRSGHSHLLYLEDDVAVSEEFDETVLEAISRDHELTFLGGGHHEPPMGEGRWKRCRKTYNNHALLFNREGARKVLRLLANWHEAWSDREIQRAMAMGVLEAWCVEPWVAFQRATASDNWGNTDCVAIAELAFPMMLPDDLAVLDAALNFCKVILEYGSGGSTLHMGSRLRDWGNLTSIEHNRDWFEKVSGLLAEHDLPVTLLLREPVPLREGDGPWRYLPGQMRNYIEAPLELFDQDEVDLVLVDGRERIACALASAKILKPGGLLMIHDFWGRSRYRAELPLLLEKFEYLFESPQRKGDDPMGMAVFRYRG